ncbi:MAG: hypothetical protein AAFX44_06755 [Pseudomonadota bacterium]
MTNNYKAERATLTRQQCWSCGKPRYMVVADYGTAGVDVTCLYCGQRWQDGELIRVGDQKASKQQARDVYRECRYD